jgi:hypothetical protein
MVIVCLDCPSTGIDMQCCECRMHMMNGQVTKGATKLALSPGLHSTSASTPQVLDVLGS